MRRLYDWLRLRRGYEPDWRIDHLVGTLESNSGHLRFRRQHTPEESLEVIATYFRNRATPKFFVDVRRLGVLALRVGQERATWKQSMIRLVWSELNEGIRLYEQTGPPLRPGFPWGGVEGASESDRLILKRPHRFAFAPRLALAALYGEPTDRAFVGLLKDWMAFASSRTNSLAYDSNLSVIQRLLALSWAWAFLAAREDPDAEQLRQEGLVLSILQSDVAYLRPRFLESFANNHLLADAFAGWYVGVVWPEFASTADWRIRFEAKWLEELERQTFADGTSFEHSTHYHEYACEMAVAYLILSRRNGLTVPDWVFERTKRLLRFQADLAGSGGVTIAVGDSAEDPLFPLDSGDGWGTAAWRELHRALFEPEFAAADRDVPSAERAFWLLGGDVAVGTGGAGPVSPLASYPRGGFYIFQEVARGSRLVFRTGPSREEAVSAGHMHADLMSVYLTTNGGPLIMDAGTYSYRAGSRIAGNGPDWRSYFRGPSAHNALAVEGRDPLGATEGDFRSPTIDTFAVTNRAVAEPVVGWVDAVIRGGGVYSSYGRGVVQIPGEYWLIYDLLPPPVEDLRRSFGFQLAPKCVVRPVGDRTVVIGSGDSEIALAASAGLGRPVCLEGSLEPLGGWVSRRYGELVPAPQVRFDVIGESAITAFLLRHAQGPETVVVDAERVGSFGIRFSVAQAGREDILILNLGSADDVIRSGEITFKGELLWIRSEKGEVRGLRWLGGELFEWPELALSVRCRERIPILEIVSDIDGPFVRFGNQQSLTLDWRGVGGPGKTE